MRAMKNVACQGLNENKLNKEMMQALKTTASPSWSQPGRTRQARLLLQRA